MAIRISLLLAAEATRDVPSEAVSVQTPLGPAGGRRVRAGVVVVPVLRAGLGMLATLFAMLLAVVATIFGLILWPLRKLRQRGKQAKKDSAPASPDGRS